MTNLEQRFVQAFRAMSDDCQRDTVTAMEAWAKAFPRRQAVTLTLLMGGSSRAVPMRKKGGERAQAV